MNKTELIEKIAVGAELSKADAKKALEATIEAIKNALVEGDILDYRRRMEVHPTNEATL